MLTLSGGVYTVTVERFHVRIKGARARTTRAWPHGLSDASTPRVSARPSPCPHDTRLRILAAMPTRCVCQHGCIRAGTEACLRTHASVPARYPCWHDARSVPALNHASMARGVLRQETVSKRRAPSQHGPSAPLTGRSGPAPTRPPAQGPVAPRRRHAAWGPRTAVPCTNILRIHDMNTIQLYQYNYESSIFEFRSDAMTERRHTGRRHTHHAVVPYTP
jgi:hypothetical protein